MREQPGNYICIDPQNKAVGHVIVCVLHGRWFSVKHYFRNKLIMAIQNLQKGVLLFQDFHLKGKSTAILSKTKVRIYTVEFWPKNEIRRGKKHLKERRGMEWEAPIWWMHRSDYCVNFNFSVFEKRGFNGRGEKVQVKEWVSEGTGTVNEGTGTVKAWPFHLNSF